MNIEMHQAICGSGVAVRSRIKISKYAMLELIKLKLGAMIFHQIYCSRKVIGIFFSVYN
jgi:hypothetical protein